MLYVIFTIFYYDVRVRYNPAEIIQGFDLVNKFDQILPETVNGSLTERNSSAVSNISDSWPDGC